MIAWKDLSFSLKVGLVGGWFSVIIFSLSFLIGFIEALLGV